MQLRKTSKPRHTPRTAMTYYCKKCGAEVLDEEKLQKHVVRIHNKQVTLSTAKEEYMEQMV